LITLPETYGETELNLPTVSLADIRFFVEDLNINFLRELALPDESSMFRVNLARRGLNMQNVEEVRPIDDNLNLEGDIVDPLMETE
jgi:hypothetical protein